MNRDSVDWRGYIPAITTAFDEAGELDIDACDQLLTWLHGHGMHGIIVLGTTGEWFSLRPGERKKLLNVAAESLGGKLPLIAGCHAFTAFEAIANTKLAADSGFDGVLLTPPPYVKPTEPEIYAFYKEVSDKCALPLCVYNWPPGTNIDMSLPLLESLANLDKVVAIKDSSADLRHFMDVFFALKERIRVFGIPMNELGVTLVTSHDADGTMGAGGVLGCDQPNFYNELWAGNVEEARQLGRRDCKIMADWFNSDYTGKFGSAQAIFKTALNLQGLPGGFPRAPILPIGEEGVQRIRKTLAGLGRV